jgi:hypothetical protein
MLLAAFKKKKNRCMGGAGTERGGSFDFIFGTFLRLYNGDRNETSGVLPHCLLHNNVVPCC